jgi:thiamine-monophosphate kinase
LTEFEFLACLREVPLHAGARDLCDDAAAVPGFDGTLVLTHDMIVEGVHFLPDDPAADVAWKLVAVNLSDLAAKGAKPVGALLGYTLAGDEAWDRAFVDGLRVALDGFGLPLIGGDTVSLPRGAPRVLGLTALGEATGPVPSRSGARPGDGLWVTGSLGDAGAGLRALKGEAPRDEALIERYRNPRPRLEAGQALAPLVSAMMDVSDGLLIDAARMAAVSGIGVEIDLRFVPLSPAFLAGPGDGRAARLAAATAGDDYELLFAAPAGRGAEMAALSERLGLPFSRIGGFLEGTGLSLTDGGEPLPLPDRLGWDHG